MSYKKIYYDDIWAATSKGSAKCNQWVSDIQELSQSFTAFVESPSFTGEAATNVKNYIEQVHGILTAVIGTIVQSYSVLATNYYGGYTRIVDTGDSKDYGLRYTTIVSDEVSETGSIQTKLNAILKTAEQVVSEANGVKNSISDLVKIAAYPKTYNLYEQIEAAKSKAQTVHDNAVTYEAGRAKDFDEIDRLIAQALLIINDRISETRTPVIMYQSGSIGTVCDFEQILVDLEATSEKVTAITENEYFQEDAELVLNREALIQEEKDSRDWAQWVAIGIAVVGSVVLIAVTAGGAAPLVCAAVGAGVAATTTASSLLANEYVEKGNFEEMDWSEFGEDVLASAAGGFVGGYLGAVSQGSAIKQPIEKAVLAMGTTVAKEGTEMAVTVGWERTETMVEVGAAVIKGRPGDEVMSIFRAGKEEEWKDISKEVKEVAVEGTKAFVGGGIAGHFDVDTSDKGVWQKIGEKTLEGVGSEAAGGAVGTALDMVGAATDGNDETTVADAFKKGAKDTVSKMAGSTVKSVISEGVADKVDGIDNAVAKVAAGTVADTVADTASTVTEGVVGRTVSYMYGEEKDAGNILGNIWEEDLQNGKAIAQSAGQALGENVVDVATEESKHYTELKKLDTDNDNQIEVVHFGEYTVTKQDYDAAIANAGKGAYEGQTAQEILGLNRDTKLESGVHDTVDIEKTKQYKNENPFTNTVTVEGKDGEKYVFKKEYYESTENAAGTKDYEGRKLREMLGVPEDTDLKDNITTDTVRTDSIGHGKKVQLHQQSGTNATKISMSDTTRQQRKEIDKAMKKIAKEFNRNIKNTKLTNE